MASRWARRWWNRVVVFAAYAYPVTLLGVVLLLRFVGEQWWVTGFGLYLPPHFFAAPLPVLALVLAVQRRFRLLAAQLVSLWLLLFPLMGLCVSWPSSASEGQKTLRLLSYNVNSCNGGCDNIAAEILAHDPQIAFVQELYQDRAGALKTALSQRYPYIQSSDQFLVASVFPITAQVDPPAIPYKNTLRPAQFVKYVIDTSLGPISFFDFHTVSPRGDFYRTRGNGFRREILSGHLFERALLEEMQRTLRLRQLQVEAVVESAAKEQGPVVLLGDSNLPQLSGVRRRVFGRFQDGYARAGFGFGNSYPSKFPWMRIDLMLTTDKLKFTHFGVGESQASDHRCVYAELTRSAP